MLLKTHHIIDNVQISNVAYNSSICSRSIFQRISITIAWMCRHATYQQPVSPRQKNAFEDLTTDMTCWFLYKIRPEQT